MKKEAKLVSPISSNSAVPRIDRPLRLVSQVEQILREAINKGRFPGDRLPTEVDLAEQLGVSRETVRRATETLQDEGLVVKIEPAESTLLGYVQADFPASTGDEEAVTRWMSGQMLQGAIEEAGKAGFELVVRRSAPAQMSKAFAHLSQSARLRGVLFASFGEEKLLRRVAGLGLPIVLLDHDLPLSHVHSVRDDSFQGARDAVLYLAGLKHRRIGFLNWRQVELNPWRLRGYRQGLRD